jgi:transposase
MVYRGGCSSNAVSSGAFRIGLEAGPLSQWLVNGMAEAGLPVVCVETRHMKALVQAQKINKSDRNDARGIAQMMRVVLLANRRQGLAEPRGAERHLEEEPQRRDRGVHLGRRSALGGQVQLVAPQILRLGLIRRSSEEPAKSATTRTWRIWRELSALSAQAEAFEQRTARPKMQVIRETARDRGRAETAARETGRSAAARRPPRGVCGGLWPGSRGTTAG